MISKADAVRAILGKGKTKPAEVVPAVKDEFGIDVTANYVSLVKSKSKVKGRKKAKATNGRKGRQAATSSNGMSVLNAGLQFVEAAGGLTEARNVLDVLERIRKMKG